MPKITLPHHALRDFCIRWKVAELALFGSVLRHDFRPDDESYLLDILIARIEPVVPPEDQV